MWRITLVAPQYPHGVTMYIWVNQITGEEEGTLQNINILNHYVGMKYIEPDSIPELQYFQYIILGMVFLGVLFFVIGSPKLFLTWAILMTILAGLGIYDFYLWEYDYGHNLSPDAPIKIDGMAYQPPLIGSKYLLNFLATSMPHTAGWLVCASILGSFGSYFLSRRKSTKYTIA